VTSIAWGLDKRVEYVFEGNINYSGATIKWLAEDLRLIKSAKESGQTALSVPDNNGVYLVPSFTGLGAPYWDTDARAIICGLTNSTKKAHIVRAAEESIAYRIKDILDLMTVEADVVLNELRADGGATSDKFLMQFQADILNVNVVTSDTEELSALGSAYMAGITAGIWKNKDELTELRERGKIYKCGIDDNTRALLYNGWKKAVKRARLKI